PLLEAGQRAGCWFLAHPGVIATLFYAAVHGATDKVIAAGAAYARALAAAMVQACLRMLALPPS
ncbi:TetR/AcrR family transcriptional regulator, partial [Pseudomonas sp. MWU13-2625]